MTITPTDTLAGALGAAMGAARLEDVVDGVKSLIQRELTGLSPDAEVVRTDYFNHTYMPDFVLEWQDQGRTSSRPVFLRNAIRPSVARDLENLEARDPVVLSLRQPTSDEQQGLGAVRTRVSSSQHALVTDALSLGRLTPRDPHGGDSTMPPLLELVRANVMRGARGLLTGAEATRLTTTASVDLDSPSARPQLDSFINIASDFFAEDASLRLRRSAELLRAGTPGEDIGEQLTGSTGRLSSSELRVLLPYLLSRPTLVANRSLWLKVGAMIDIEALVDSAQFLVDLDLTPLVRPNLPVWAAKRAQLVINAKDVDEEPQPGWRLRGNALCGEAGPWLLFLATDARHLKGREGSAGRVPEWTEVNGALAGFVLGSVSLRGLARRVEIGAEESGDVAQDVRLVIDSLEDSFSIPFVTVRSAGAGWHVDVDFAAMTATASRGGGDALTLARAGLELLAYRQPVSSTVLIDQRDTALVITEEP